MLSDAVLLGVLVFADGVRDVAERRFKVFAKYFMFGSVRVSS